VTSELIASCELREIGMAAAWLNFASAKFFSFCREAKFGDFRLTSPAQVICNSLISDWQRGEID
jgi:hypothetical protein